MKKIISIAFAAILAGFAISCQKEELVSEKTDAVQYTFNITVNELTGFDNDASTKGGTPNYKTAWENGDKIFLFFQPTSGSLLTDTYATLSYDGSAWGGSVTGSTSLGESGTLSAVYIYNLGSDVEPEYSDTDSKWTIATGNVFYNCQTGVSYTVSGSEISASLNLMAPTDFVRFRMMLSPNEPLTCDKVKGWKDVVIGSDMTFSNATCTGYMSGVAVSPGFSEFYGRIVSGASLKNVACEFSVVKDGKVYEYTATPSSDARSFEMGIASWTSAAGKLPGLFTVGKGPDDKAGTADDVMVRFSQGNLYAKYEGDKWNWKFYDKQYQYNSLSTSETRTAASTDTEIDLFTWGYNNDNSVDPVGFDRDNVSITSGNLSQEQDWGSQIGDGNTWRTLTTAEWQYLFSYDGSTYGGENYENDIRRDKYKYGVTVCGKTNCVVLLPDNWEWKESTVGTDWQTGGYPETADDNHPVTWQAMEAAGAVCLPAAGRRKASDVSNVGSWGRYWSSSASNGDNAYYMDFSGDPRSNVGRNFGNSVRLITECQ